MSTHRIVYTSLVLAFVTAGAARADIIDMVAGQNSIREVSFDATTTGTLTFTKPVGGNKADAITAYTAPEADVKLGCRRSGYRAWSLGSLSLGGTQAVVERTLPVGLSKQPKGASGKQEAGDFLDAYCLAKRTDEVTLLVSVQGVCKKVKTALGKTWTHYRTPDHQVKFKITCAGYDAAATP